MIKCRNVNYEDYSIKSKGKLRRWHNLWDPLGFIFINVFLAYIASINNVRVWWPELYIYILGGGCTTHV